WVSTHSGVFRLAQKLAAIFSRVLSPREKQLRLPAITGWGYSKDFPRPALKPFRERFESANQRISELANRRVSESADQRVGDSTSQRVGESTDQRVSGSAKGRFEEELTALNGVFVACTEDELAGRILSLLKERGVDEIMSWEAEQLPEGLADSLSEAGIRIRYAPQPSIRVGLTAASGAAASTGTLILASGPGRPQAVSLFPKIHIAVLYKDDIKANLPQALKLQDVQTASSVALISGPSRTADIEMALTIGVHGPEEVHVFCLGT
ncbi:MAG: LUD domain-containing protein, partial [Chloroflexota bacterium]|nr:LUD domain-containing protein [Chloroflexota bacterium]